MNEPRRLDAHEAELVALADATSSPSDGDDLLGIARQAMAVASAITADAAPEAADEEEDWQAVVAEGHLMVGGPDFLLTADAEAGSMLIVSGTTTWSMLPVDQNGKPIVADDEDPGAAIRQAGRGLLGAAATRVGLGALTSLVDGPIRVTVSDRERQVADWTFGATGAVDNADFSAQTAQLEEEVNGLMSAAVEDEAAVHDESESSDGSAGRGGMVAGGITAAVTGMAVREGVRRTRSAASTAPPAPPAPPAPAPPPSPSSPPPPPPPPPPAEAKPVLYWFGVESEVWAQSAAGEQVVLIVPGAWYPAHEENGGWVSTTRDGLTGWIPAWAVRRAQ